MTDRRVIWAAFYVLVILGALAVCTPQARAETGWARLNAESDTYVKWRVALTMPENVRPRFIRFYMGRKARAIQRARKAHIEWAAEVAARRVPTPIPWTGSFDRPSGSFSGPVADIICKVFGRFCRQAQAVSWCESRHDPSAANGQYLGTFQMGERERAIYGHGPDAWTQARAAYGYFADTGFDWSPWSCKP